MAKKRGKASQREVPSHYRLGRTKVVDSAGTLAWHSLLTVDCDRLAGSLRRCFEGSGVPAESLAVAWMDTVERGENALAEFSAPTVTVFDDAKERILELIPDMTVTRGGASLTLKVERTVSGTTIKAVDSGTPYRSLEELGDDVALLQSLRDAKGEISVAFDLSALVESVPRLTGDLATGPLPFKPFFEEEDFAEFLESEADDSVVAMLPGGTEWNGYIPLDTWFPGDELMHQFDDAGYADDLTW
jgi:hypothetical protein